jgi:DNA-binding transcriptional regulator YiaG
MRAYDMIMEGLSGALQYEKGEIEARKARVRVIVQPVPAFPAAKIKSVRTNLGLSQKGMVSTKTV